MISYRGGLGDVDVSLFDQRGGEAVQHGQDQGADLEAVLIRIGTDNNFRPTQRLYIKGNKIPFDLATDFHAAADHPKQIYNYIVFEDLFVGAFQAVQRFTPHRNNRLKFRIPSQLTAGHSGITLYNIQFPAQGIP